MLNEKDFKVTTAEGSSAQIKFIKNEDSVLYFDFSYESEKEQIPEKVEVYFELPSIRVFSFWSPVNQLNRGLAMSCTGNFSESRLAYGAPIFSSIGQAGENLATIAISDAKTPLEIKAAINEGNGNVWYRISFFTIQIAPISKYNATIRIDLRDIPYYKAIENVNLWWETDCGYTPAFVPEAAKEAVYSSWYTFHQDLKTKTIIEQCEIAKKMGMEVVIFDDGWYLNQKNASFTYCGDWEVCTEKIPDMKELVDSIHKIGMKFMLWFSVSFVGNNSKLRERFKDKILEEFDRGWATLDPRYPDVREYLINVYEKAAIEWGLDGFKLDFIDSFRLAELSKKPDDRRDFVSVEDAVNKLLIDVMERLTKIKPDMLFEFRQAYIGPCVKTFGNMLRVSDCPNDSLINRVGIGDLRLTSGKTAVHGDMLMWHKEDTPQSAAKQIIAVLYGIPQISVDLTAISEEHLKVVNFYLDFWKKNKDALIDGEFIPLNPESNYSAFIGKTENKVVATAYTGNHLKLDCTEDEIILVNGTGFKGIILETKNQFDAEIEIFDCMGNVIDKYSASLEKLNKIKVPVSGIGIIKKK